MSGASAAQITPSRTKRQPSGGSGLGELWRVIVLNDNHNTFEGVAKALSTVLPGVSFDDGLRFAAEIHRDGQAVVWIGHREQGEHYWAQLQARGLTMAPLEN